MSAISSAPADRRRVFWTTQPDACGSGEACGADCGQAGLALAALSNGSRSIVNADWVRGLALNILLTDGRMPDNRCGWRPGAQGGHWSESFRKDGQKIGTTVRSIPAKGSIRESIALVRAQLIADMAKLVKLKIAQDVIVETEYLGGNKMAATITIIAPDGVSTSVGLSGTRTTNAWAWK